jgi:hypothetical protein
MRKIATVLAVLAAMLLVPGVAEANPSDYVVAGTWSLEEGMGSPTIVPHIEDDVVEVRCKGDDRLLEYYVSDQELVAWEGITADKSAVQVQPDLREIGQRLTITALCNVR